MLKSITKTARYVIYAVVLVYSLIVLSIFILPLFKLNPLSVNNNRMEPVYNEGTLVVTYEVETDKIHTNDIVTYTTKEKPYLYDTGRVVAKDIEQRSFEVKGDNQKQEQKQAISFVNVIGKVLFGVPFAGYVNTFLSNTTGRIISAAVIIGLLVMPYLLKIFIEDK